MTRSTSTFRHNNHLRKYQNIESFLDKPVEHDQSPINRQHEKLAKAHAAFIILRSKNRNFEAFNLATDLCKTAKKYRMPKFLIEPSVFLYRYYSQFQFNRPKALKMKSLNNWAIEAYRAEIEVHNNLSEIILSDRSKHSKKTSSDTVDRVWKDLLPIFDKFQTFDFKKEAFMIGMNHYRQHSSWNRMEDLAIDALNFFQSFPLKSEPIIAIYFRHLINALLGQNKSSHIDSHLLEYEQVAKRAPVQWINYQYTVARIRAVQNRYSEVEALIISSKKSRAYKSISGINKLAWEIIDGYISYMTRSKLNKKGKLVLSNPLVEAKEKDMLSDRYRIQLLILRLIHYTFNQEWQMVESNSSAISKYLSRKLIRSGESRSYNFIQMLLHLSKQRFHPIAVKRHSSRFYAKLVSEPSIAQGSQESYEIIPYERLWEMIMENLKK